MASASIHGKDLGGKLSLDIFQQQERIMLLENIFSNSTNLLAPGKIPQYEDFKASNLLYFWSQLQINPFSLLAKWIDWNLLTLQIFQSSKCFHAKKVSNYWRFSSPIHSMNHLTLQKILGVEKFMLLKDFQSCLSTHCQCKILCGE